MKFTKKKFLSLALAGLMIASAPVSGSIALNSASVVASAYESGDEIVYNGTCGENVKFQVTSDGTLTVSPIDRSIPEAVFYNASFLRKGIKKLIVEEGITELGNCSFELLENLENVQLPSTLKKIGMQCFEESKNITSLTIDENNPFFDSRDNCNAIIETATDTLIIGFNCSTIPDGVKRIGEDAFLFCKQLKSIYIPASVNHIGMGAFHGCYALESIVVDENNTFYDSREGCNSLINTELDHLIVGSNNSFIPNGVKSIGSCAFYGRNNLKSIYIPRSVKSISYSSFLRCGGLESIIVDEDNFYYDSRENCNALIETESNTLIRGCDNAVIPYGVTAIGEYAFTDCSELKNISIPDSVTEIGYNAFSDCSELKNISIPDSVTKIGHNAFGDCISLESIQLPNSVTSVGTEVFSNCRSLKSVSLSNSLSEISSGMFRRCYSLESIVIPSGVTVLDWYAFRECCALKSVYISDTVTAVVGIYGFGENLNLESIVVDENNPVYDSRDNCNAIIETATNTLVIGCYKTVIPSTVTAIGKNAFHQCYKLEKIVIPSNVKTIGVDAFEQCFNLTDVTLEEGVTTICDGAFQNCGFKTFVIPDSVKELGGNVFSADYNLENITIGKNIETIKTGTFLFNSKLKKLVIPENVKTIEKAYWA